MYHAIKITALALAVSFAAPMFAEDAKPFADATQIDLTALLPTPPATGSAAMNAELAQVLTIQVTRTEAQAARAVADDAEDAWVFSDVIANPKFTKENLPKFTAFFDRVTATEGAVVDPSKKIWARPRPYMYSELVMPLLDKSKSGAYPSGHATVGTLMGIVLANMVPEKHTEIMARAWEYGQNRVVAGMHFPTDIEAGHISGSVIAETIMAHPDFIDEFAAAKTELRAALGL
ncbi:MAG: phosphatase PAP2 family protein [Pseudorhodobacter sp.]|nr:phosphatase PAP2 family protein [Pseudorhodobacter sp.]